MQIQEYKCQTRENIQSFKKDAILNECSQDTVSASVLLEGEVAFFKIHRNTDSGLERWQIAEKKANLPSKLPTKNKTVEVKENDPPKTVTKVIKKPSKFKTRLYSSLSYNFNINSPKVEDNGTLANNNALQAFSRKSNHFNLDIVGIKILSRIKNGIFMLHLAEGDATDVLHSDTSSQIGNTDLVKEAYAKYMYDKDSKTRLVIGRIESPLFKDQLNRNEQDFYTPSITKTLGLPHLQQGVGAKRKLSKSIDFELHLINGWSVSQEERDGIGLSSLLQYQLSDKLKMKFGVVTSDDKVNNSSTSRLLLSVDTDYRLAKNHNLSFMWINGESSGEAASDGSKGVSWSSLLFEYVYGLSDTSQAALRFENYSQTSGYLNLQTETIQSLALSYKKNYYRNLAGFYEFQYDQSDDNFFPQDSDKITDTQMIIRAGVSLEL